MKKTIITATMVLTTCFLAFTTPSTSARDKKDLGSADFAARDKKDLGSADARDKKDLGSADFAARDKKDLGSADFQLV